MTDEQTPQADTDAAEAAVADLDISDWLNDAVNAEKEITLYKDGTTLLQVKELAHLADEATDQAKQSAQAGLSIADEYGDAANDALYELDAARAKLKPSGLTVKLRSIGTESRDILIKKTEREARFAAVPAKDGQPAVPGGREHPDFQETFENLLLSKCIVSVTDANGRTRTKPWSVTEVHGLRKLPLNEFTRLWNQCYNLHYTQYRIEEMVDLDFSSRL